MALDIRTAAELIDPELEARWTTRRAARETDVLQRVLRAFVERPGPVAVEQIVAAFADGPSEGIRQALARLDEDDLIQIRDGLVDVAYPFSAFPTPFVVQLANGQERCACCAIDALGIAPMLGSGCASGHVATTAGRRWNSGSTRPARGWTPRRSWSGSASKGTASGVPRPRSERRSTSSGRKST